ncbi:hypothetical protein [Bacteriovorax sp. Seq25_V]|uniref:hypothetical protein n=1 Tax=Bacteriovorax sp. Seq25_V TaxID=1201288 RepID=UPI0012F70CBA|nr:hypothetical protein [Bacteriovorax sp. Seq25_V]
MIFVKLKSKNITKLTTKELLLNRAEHEWIRQDKILYRFFKESMELLTPEDFTKLNKQKELCFLYSTGKYASTLAAHNNKQFIILYPEFIGMVRSVDNTIAFAILFHELGHIYFGHNQSMLSVLDKQFEADLFACKYGFENELLEILYGENKTNEVIQRISRIQEYQKSHRSHQ